ncbi:MAG: hypothetical protein H0U73_11695 [Tatlockia sp.]|nr:hypothetical protein [Tatlockia sp.]
MHLIIIGCLLSFNAFTSTDSPVMMISDSDYINNRWSVLGSLGYSGYQQIRTSGSQTGLARLALAREFINTSQANFGLELGLQSGYHIHLVVPPVSFPYYGRAISTSIMPILDLLITAQANPINESLLFTQIKGGIAYRHWRINNSFFENKSEISGELQAGIGYPLTEISNLNILYQGIFGGNPKIRINPFTYAGYITTLPIQHGLLLGLSIIV